VVRQRSRTAERLIDWLIIVFLVGGFVWAAVEWIAG
jgi:hypothetical protein